MENLNYFKNAGNQGYILLPRRLLLNAMFLQSPERQYYRLYIYLLLKATYGEGRTDGESLKRGELYFSYRTLCEQFSVCRATLSKMLNEMEECELIEIYRGKTNRQSSKIKMLYYEQMCDFATIFEERQESRTMNSRSSGIYTITVRDWNPSTRSWHTTTGNDFRAKNARWHW